MQELYNQTSVTAGRSVEVSKVLRNTYMLLAMTLTFSAIMAVVSMSLQLGYGSYLMCVLGAMALIWFVLPRTANSAAGIWVVFAFTGLLGAGLGPVISHYLTMVNGGAIVTQALAGTALIFFALSGYVLVTGKDFSFMAGFIITGMLAVIVAMLGSFVMAMMGMDISILELAISCVFLLLMSAVILFKTSQIIHGGETNYILATASLYMALYNIFVNLLHLLSAADD